MEIQMEGKELVRELMKYGQWFAFRYILPESNNKIGISDTRAAIANCFNDSFEGKICACSYFFVSEVTKESIVLNCLNCGTEKILDMNYITAAKWRYLNSDEIFYAEFKYSEDKK